MSDDSGRRATTEVEALLKSEQMNELASYLSRGRKHEALATDILNAEFEKAFKLFAQTRDGRWLNEVNDLLAELRIRGIELASQIWTAA